jgi:hypothetical protein
MAIETQRTGAVGREVAEARPERGRAGTTTSRRLVVLVPAGALDEARLARQIWALAAAGPRPVLYVGLSRSAADEPLVRRRLASLAALTRDEQVTARTRLATEQTWLRAAQAVQRPGDEWVCAAGEQAPRWGPFGRRPLSEALRAGLGQPVNELAGVGAQADADRAGARAWLGFWAGAAAVVAVFFWLEVRLAQLPDTPGRMALVLLVVVAEFAVLGWWGRPKG